MAQQQPLPPRNDFIHKAAIAGAIVTPLAMLLPPRKLDLRFLILAGTFSIATNQLAYEYTGQSIYSRFGARASAVFDVGLPEQAKRTQQLLKEQRERQVAQHHNPNQAAEDKTQTKGGLIKDLWMGGQTEDWSQKRAEEHRKSFEEGKGMSSIILEQIMDVWNGNWRGDAKRNDISADVPGDHGRSGQEMTKEAGH